MRNTCRYLLSNLFDFDPARDAVAEADLEDVDRYALARHRQVVARVLEGYRDFEFHVIYHQVVQYCAVDLSAFYLDVLKDRLYCDAKDAPRRRSAQTLLHKIARCTEPGGLPGMTAQTSSEVKGRTGAIRAARSRAMRWSTVCAERRRGPSAASQ